MHLRTMNVCLTSLMLILTPIVTHAMFCPTNFQTINIGDTMAQVTQQCGAPDAQKEATQPNENVPQEWDYYIPQTVSVNTLQAAQGTLKTSITFDSSGKAINITVNGLGVGATTICGTSIQLGQNRSDVKSACGDPGFVNKQTPAGANAPPADIKTMEYDYNSVNPPVKLFFENGILKSTQ